METTRSILLRLLFSKGICLIIFASALEAKPAPDHVAKGTAQFHHDGKNLIVYPSDNAIIIYKSFDINSDECVRFEMKDVSHRVLNRIHGKTPSQIDGHLLSNGSVYLVNPAGIVFGSNSVVNVGQLFAAAGHLSDEDFLAKHDRFTDTKGRIEIYGNIVSEKAIFVGQSILQKGDIEGSKVIYAIGEKLLLGNEGEHLFVEIEHPEEFSERKCFLESGSPEAFLLHHTGRTHGQEVAIHGDTDARVCIEGSIVAEKGPIGGDVMVYGDVIELKGAQVDVSGFQGGGNILIGGASHGEGPYPTALYLEADGESLISSNAIDQGDGGRVVLWADKATIFNAKISAKGGVFGGNGGYVETSSGDQFTSLAGNVNTSAPMGKMGQWDLDPFSIQIQAGAPLGPTLADLASGDANTYIVNPSVINAAVSNVLLNATNTGTGTNIFLGTIGTPATVNITAPNVDLTLATFDSNGSFNPHGSMTTTGNISVQARTVLQGPTELVSTGGGITFENTINSDTPSTRRDLTLEATGDIIFKASVGGNPVGALTIRNANNVNFLSQPNLNLAVNTMHVSSFTQLAGMGDTNFEGPLLTTGAPVQAIVPPTPMDGGDVSITTSGAINFYYLVNVGGVATPQLSFVPGDLVFNKAVITTTGGRVQSSTPGDGFSGGDVTLNADTLNLLGIYAGGTPAFPGTTGVGGSGGTVNISTTSGTTLKGPIIATGGPGANGGGQVLPTLIFPGQNVNQQGADSPGDITIDGPLTLDFNGIQLRGGNMTLGDIASTGQNLLSIDAGTHGVVTVGELSNLSYLVVDNAHTVNVTSNVDADGITLFNAGEGGINFAGDVNTLSLVAIKNEFDISIEGDLMAADMLLLNCGENAFPSEPSGPSSGTGQIQDQFAGSFSADPFIFQYGFWYSLFFNNPVIFIDIDDNEAETL